MEPIDLLVVIGQRKDSYPGENTPEALAVITEYGNDGNPDYIQDELKKAKSDPDMEAAAIFTITISRSEIDRVLRPQAKPLQGQIKSHDLGQAEQGES